MLKRSGARVLIKWPRAPAKREHRSTRALFNMDNIFKNTNYHYNKPANFNESDPEFAIFKNIKPDRSYISEVKKFKNIRISSNSVAFYCGKIIKETCISRPNYLLYQRKALRFFLKYFWPKFNFSNKRFLLITDEWTSNYYHWHIFALMKLLVFKEKNLLENSKLFLPIKYKNYSFTLPALRKFGIRDEQIVYCPKKSHIKVKELLFVKTAQHNNRAVKKIRDILTKDVTLDLGLGDKIYISREGQRVRTFDNEKELVALLEKYGFKKIIAEKFSYEEQIAIAHKARYIISPHGAGLTNILFMKPQSSVLELATEVRTVKPVTDYLRLADMLDLNYYYQECDIGPKGLSGNSHDSNMIADLEKLEKNLKLMLA